MKSRETSPAFSSSIVLPLTLPPPHNTGKNQRISDTRGVEFHTQLKRMKEWMNLVLFCSILFYSVRCECLELWRGIEGIQVDFSSISCLVINTNSHPFIVILSLFVCHFIIIMECDVAILMGEKVSQREKEEKKELREHESWEYKAITRGMRGMRTTRRRKEKQEIDWKKRQCNFLDE